MGVLNMLDYYKVSEMMVPSVGPRPPRGTLGAASAQPVFKNAGGSAINSIVCGQPYTFDVPGYNNVWLTMKKDGKETYDGEFSVPMPSYVASCASDPGTYQAIAYDLDSGIVLGTATFQVLPAGSADPGTSGTAAYPTGNLPHPELTTWIVAGLIGLYFFTRKGK
jgi:hypothetical protein